MFDDPAHPTADEGFEFAVDEHASSYLSVEFIAKQHSELLSDLEKLNLAETASVFGGLLARPELQANCLRLEAALHLSVAYCRGHFAPSREFVERCFAALGDGTCGMMEDPSEDVFVSLVSTAEGNFRVFEGAMEATAFHLQRVLNVLETMPSANPVDDARTSIHSLLRLSDAVAERAGVREYTLGEEDPQKEIPAHLGQSLQSLAATVVFDASDLESLGIDSHSLSDFVLDVGTGADFRAVVIGNSELERRPLLRDGDSVCFVLPTAVGSAVTRRVVELVESLKLTAQFDRALVAEYIDLFIKTPIFGGRRLPEDFFAGRIDGGRIGSAMRVVDEGRCLQLIFFFDSLDAFSVGGLGGANADPVALGKALDRHIEAAARRARQGANYLEGVTILVACGIGRRIETALSKPLPEGWSFDCIGAADLVTLSWARGFSPLSLFRLAAQTAAIERHGTELLNVNGLTNLVAVARRGAGHLVRHSSHPDDIGGQVPNVLVIEQNALRGLRYEVLTDRDPRRILDVSLQWVPVKRIAQSAFEEDCRDALFTNEEEYMSGRLRAAYLAPRHTWWAELKNSDKNRNASAFGHWEMICEWLRRAAPVLDSAYPGIPDGPLQFSVEFERFLEAEPAGAKPKGSNELRQLLRLRVDRASHTLEIYAAAGFEYGFLQAANVAERVLVEVMLDLVSQFAGEEGDVDKKLSLLECICPNEQARHMHVFQARHFRDYVREAIPEPILIDVLDDATNRIGLGWRTRERSSGPEIVGVESCTFFLNSTVSNLLADVCDELRRFNRPDLVMHALMNHEAAAWEALHWQRTTSAMLGFRKDRMAARGSIARHYADLNACTITARLLIEAGICECPIGSGRRPGRLDLSRIMSKLMLIFHLGGFSDAIRWGAIEPRIKITCFGDIHIDHDFIDKVFMPLGISNAETRVDEDADDYSENYEPPVKLADALSEHFEPEFVAAWNAEFGISLDSMDAFISAVEELAIARSEAILTLGHEELLQLAGASTAISAPDTAAFLERFTLRSRPSWMSPPDGFENRDWHPWRFRRGLSLYRRPILYLSDTKDGPVLVGPGILRQSFVLTASIFHTGDVPDWQIKSTEMRRWKGQTSMKRGSAFTRLVAGRMRDLGWNVLQEVKIPSLLRRSLPKDYGDVDVLAWNSVSGRVLLIECKHVHYRKTFGEVAEQLADFRGETRSDGQADLLKKHLDRIELLEGFAAELGRALNIYAVPSSIEGHLIFRHPVPMRYAWDHMASKVGIWLFNDLHRL